MKIVTIVAIQLMLGYSLVCLGQPVAGQLVHWNFDEISGDTVYDVSGNGRYAVLTNGPQRVEGKAGGAVYFDGVDDYAPYESLYPSSPQALTVAFWVKRGNPAGGVAIYHGRFGEWAIGAASDHCWTNIKPDCCDWIQVVSPVEPDSMWHHLAMTWMPGDSLRLYFDGRQIGSRPVPNNLLLDPSWNDFHPAIGAYTELPVVRDFFRGTIDEIAIYDWAFTAPEIWANFRRLGFKPGDANGDGVVSVTDAVFMIHYIFASGVAPDPISSGDPNCDNKTNISDAVFLINFIFGGGPSPCGGK